ncbi:MAG: hypothetical protein COA42_04870 [Alteromonadaceae bacterium]|nr:MAG: hypothetical protein COA42_04870 [Alteromonadaceae bacterium]
MLKFMMGVFSIAPLCLGVATVCAKGYGYTSKPKDLSFTDISEQFDFVRQNLPGGYGPSGMQGIGGIALFDYNNDGNLDIYFSNGAGFDNGLYRNNGDGTFTDVTASAGVAYGKGSSGVVAGDVDNDGFTDLFLVGRPGIMAPALASAPVLYHNQGDGTFKNITLAAGITIADENGQALPLRAVISAAMADIDGDGYLDIYMTNPGGVLPDANGKLFHNNGDLTFTEIGEEAGLAGDLGACVTAFSDYDADGDSDLFVGSCGLVEPAPGGLGFLPVLTPVSIYRNDGDLKFTDVTKVSGMGDELGLWMSLSFGDFNNDGHIDLFSTNFGKDVGAFPFPFDNPHGLFKNNGDGTFTNIASEAGVANLEFGWGSSVTDFDNDGFADIFLAGSFALPPLSIVGPGAGNPGRLFLSDNKDYFKPNTFTEVKTDGEDIGFDMENDFPSGVAFGDLNNDGFQDIVVLREQLPPLAVGEPLVMLNNGNKNHWIDFDLKGVESNASAVGARVTIKSGHGCQTQEVYAGSSFASSDTKRIHFGLGKRRGIRQVKVDWPSGKSEFFRSGYRSADKVYTLTEGEGYSVKNKKRAKKWCSKR